MHHRIKMSYLEPILVHPVRRQNFGDTVAQKCNPYLIRCHTNLNLHHHFTWKATAVEVILHLFFILLDDSGHENKCWLRREEGGKSFRYTVYTQIYNIWILKGGVPSLKQEILLNRRQSVASSSSPLWTPQFDAGGRSLDVESIRGQALWT